MKLNEYSTKVPANQSLKVTSWFLAYNSERAQSIEWQGYVKTPFIHVILFIWSFLTPTSAIKKK